MPRIVTLKEALAYDKGEIIPSVRGKLTALYDRNSGTNDRGEWSIQNAELTDATGKIKLKITDRDALPKEWKGREVVLSCNDGNKGLTGLKADDDTYKGKTSKIIKVTPSAHIDLAQADSAHENSGEPEPESDRSNGFRPESNGIRTSPNGIREKSNGSQKTPNGSHFDVARVRITLSQAANLYLHSMLAASYVRDTYESVTGQPMCDEHFQATCASLFIKADREGLLTATPPGKFENQIAPKQPQREQQEAAA